MEKIYFAKMREDVKIPTKREEDGGYDIYANFPQESILIKPHETVMIPTKLKSAFDKKYRIILAERGSTGSKGIAQRCGVIDSGYRGEWFVPLTNTTNVPIAIIKEERRKIVKMTIGDEITIYPYEKAICQALLEEVPVVEVEEITEEELMAMESERGTGKIGSSNK